MMNLTLNQGCMLEKIHQHVTVFADVSGYSLKVKHVVSKAHFRRASVVFLSSKTPSETDSMPHVSLSVGDFTY